MGTFSDLDLWLESIDVKLDRILSILEGKDTPQGLADASQEAIAQWENIPPKPHQELKTPDNVAVGCKFCGNPMSKNSSANPKAPDLKCLGCGSAYWSKSNYWKAK